MEDKAQRIEELRQKFPSAGEMIDIFNRDYKGDYNMIYAALHQMGLKEVNLD